jgi:hypothetical protein
LAIADDAGEEWAKRARKAAKTSSAGESSNDDGSAGVRLLAALRDVFGDADQLPTAMILAALNAEDHEAGFARWNDGAGIEARNLARLLRPFGVRRAQLWVAGENVKGYRRDDLTDSFARSLRDPSDGSDRPKVQSQNRPNAMG